MPLPTPPELGLPAKFPGWRPGQPQLLRRMLASERRFIALAAPVGSGKSVLNLGYVLGLGARACYLTATKGLQDQLMQDARSIGLVDVRGMGNYKCLAYPSRLCDDAPCLDGAHCSLRSGGCLYYDAVARARKAELVVTNYAFWLQHTDDDAIGDFDVLICDEAHEIVEEVARRLRVTVTRSDALGLLGDTEPDAVWRRDAGWQAVARAKELRGRERQHYRMLAAGLQRVDVTGNGHAAWVGQQQRSGWSWEPAWPGRYTEALLWRRVPRVVLSSATIRPKQLGHLGIDKAQCEWLDAPSPFPASKRPVFLVKGSPRLSNKSSTSDIEAWLGIIDGIIGEEIGNGKGIVHTVSYDRARYVTANSRHRSHMLMHAPKQTASTVQEFRAMSPPAILVSPVMHTGWDFIDEAARWQIIGKVPFPDSRDPVTKARQQQDKEYGIGQAITTMAQMVGRIVRGEGDWGRTYITDGQAGWVLFGHKHLVPRWMLEALRNK